MLLKPTNNPLGVSPSKGKQGTSSTLIYTSELILCSTICVPSATRHNIHMYPYFLFAAIHHLKSSPTFSARPCSSVGRVTVDLIRRSWVRFPRGQKIFSLPRVVPCFPLLGLTPCGLFMGLSSTLIYTSELILCSTTSEFDWFTGLSASLVIGWIDYSIENRSN